VIKVQYFRKKANFIRINFFFAKVLKTKEEIKQIGREVLTIEIKGLQDTMSQIDDHFYAVVKHLLESKGRVVLSGIGKSALIAKKIAATLNSTGTPALFMHAADAIHGDLGIIQKEDAVILLSNSGNTPEIKYLVPLVKQSVNKLIAITGNPESFLAKEADYLLLCKVEKEACPNNLAPTTSTTAQLALGDAIAIALLSCRNFSAGDFSKYHPGGNLGKKLYLTAGDLAERNLKPKIFSNAPIKEVIIEISKNRMGAVPVFDRQTNNLIGIITDGDIRRMLEKHNQLDELKAIDIMSENPKTVESGTLAVNTISIFKENKISQLIVNKEGQYFGMFHFHDLNKEGIN
jgi:arabinose-5-phosphate isomerase